MPLSFRFGPSTVLAVLAFLGVGMAAALEPPLFFDLCVVPDSGAGTVQLPPRGCAWTNDSPAATMSIIDGLPPGTTIDIRGALHAFHCSGLGFGGPCIVEPSEIPFAGGERQTFDAVFVLEMEGTGDLDGYHRILAVPMSADTRSGPRTPGDPEQQFPHELWFLTGTLPAGDPDFALLEIVAGTGWGLPSPGSTTLTRLGPPGSDFQVDSFFDISYQIEFTGAAGGALEGLTGQTFSTVRLTAHGQDERCVEVDDGTGTADIPPLPCSYIGPRQTTQQQIFEIIDGLPPGTTIELVPRMRNFVCTDAGGICGQPGGNLGGEIENFDATMVWQLEGTGTLAGFRRTLRLPSTAQTHTGPRTPGDPVQAFPADLFNLLGTLSPGDPDFASLTLTAGTGNGLPSPGHVTLFDNGGGTFNVDSFFDIEYRIDFVGAPSGALNGLSGSTTAVVRLETRAKKVESIEPEVDGSVEQPPHGSRYLTDEPYMIINGLPPGSTIELAAAHEWFDCLQPGDVCGVPGGTLGGEVEQYDAIVQMVATGTGSLAGFRRSFPVGVSTETHSGPHMTGTPAQIFDADLFDLSGSLVGDPDFDILTITVGAANGLPSPGHTTLTGQGDGTFMVDSFFDVTYRIDFVGAPGGMLDGLSGSTTGQTRVTAFDDQSCPSLVAIGARTFGGPETVQSLSVLEANGALMVNADANLEARRVIALDEGFEASVAAGATLTLGLDPTIYCPLIP